MVSSVGLRERHCVAAESVRAIDYDAFGFRATIRFGDVVSSVSENSVHDPDGFGWDGLFYLKKDCSGRRNSVIDFQLLF